MIFFKKKTKDELIKELGVAEEKAQIRFDKQSDKRELRDIRAQIEQQKSQARTSLSSTGLSSGFKKGSILFAKGVIATGKGLGTVLTEAAKNQAANQRRSQQQPKQPAKKRKKKKTITISLADLKSLQKSKKKTKSKPKQQNQPKPFQFNF